MVSMFTNVWGRLYRNPAEFAAGADYCSLLPGQVCMLVQKGWEQRYRRLALKVHSPGAHWSWMWVAWVGAYPRGYKEVCFECTHCRLHAQNGCWVNEWASKMSLSYKRASYSERIDPFRKGYDHLIFPPVGSRALAIHFLWATCQR